MNEKLKKDCILLDTLIYYEKLQFKENIKLKTIIEKSKQAKGWNKMMKMLFGREIGKKAAVLNDIQNDPRLSNLRVVDFTYGKDLKELSLEKPTINSALKDESLSQ